MMITGRNTRCRLFGQWGLTLLELLVVIAILAVLASVAVSVTTDVESDTRTKASLDTLSGVKSAILGQFNSVGGYGGAQNVGFVADMGRLPVAEQVVGVDFTYLAVPELYRASSPNLRSYGIYTNSLGSVVFGGDVSFVVPASLTVFNTSSPPATQRLTNALSDSTLRLPVGWRGPYLRLKDPGAGILDGWGKELVSLPQGMTSLELSTWPVGLLTANSGGSVIGGIGSSYEAVLLAGTAVYGAFLRPGFDAGSSVGLATNAIYSEAVANSDFRVSAAYSVTIASNFPANLAASHRLIVVMYGPNPNATSASAPILGTLRVLPYFNTNIFTINGSFDGYGATIGPRVFRAILYRGGDSDATLIKGTPVYVNLSTANELVRLTIP